MRVPLLSVSCPTSHLCVAVDGSARTIAGDQAIGCPTSPLGNGRMRQLAAVDRNQPALTKLPGVENLGIAVGRNT
jgi:hypothetical protein